MPKDASKMYDPKTKYTKLKVKIHIAKYKMYSIHDPQLNIKSWSKHIVIYNIYFSSQAQTHPLNNQTSIY